MKETNKPRRKTVALMRNVEVVHWAKEHKTFETYYFLRHENCEEEINRNSDKWHDGQGYDGYSSTSDGGCVYVKEIDWETANALVKADIVSEWGLKEFYKQSYDTKFKIGLSLEILDKLFTMERYDWVPEDYKEKGINRNYGENTWGFIVESKEHSEEKAIEKLMPRVKKFMQAFFECVVEDVDEEGKKAMMLKWNKKHQWLQDKLQYLAGDWLNDFTIKDENGIIWSEIMSSDFCDVFSSFCNSVVFSDYEPEDGSYEYQGTSCWREEAENHFDYIVEIDGTIRKTQKNA